MRNTRATNRKVRKSVGLSPRTKDHLLSSPKENTPETLEKQHYTKLSNIEVSGKHANVAFATRSPFTPSRKFAIKSQVISSPTNLSDRAYRELIIFEQLEKLKDSVHFPSQSSFVTVVEWFKTKSHDGEPCMHYVMECADMTLSELKQTTLYQYKCILFQILFGLYIAQNECEFVHNDLHMKNVLLFKSKDNGTNSFVDGDDTWYTSGHVVKITDFGLSRIRLGTSVIYNLKNPITELFDPSTDVLNIVTEMVKIKILPDGWVEDTSLSPDAKKTLAKEKKKELESFRRLAKSGARLDKILRHAFFEELQNKPENIDTPEKRVATKTIEVSESPDNDKENVSNHSNVPAKTTVSTPFKFKF